MGCLPGAEVKVEVTDNTNQSSAAQSGTNTQKVGETSSNTNQTSGTATIEPSTKEYAACASFETEFPPTAFADIKPYEAQIEVSYVNQGVEYKMAINSASFGPNGEILIGGKEGDYDFVMRGQFTAEGKVRMVKYYVTHKVKYIGELKGDTIVGKWFLPGCSGTFMIVFKGKKWTVDDNYLTYPDGATVNSVGQFGGKWGVVHGTKTGDELNLEVDFANGTKVNVTATEGTDMLTVKLPTAADPENQVIMLPA